MIPAVSPENRIVESITIPEKSAYDWCISLLILLLSIAYLRLFYNYTLINGDEGIVLQGAQRVLEGEVPYRDFFSFFTPGSYYWLALFFKVFGSSILVARAVLMVEGGLFSVLTYLLARRVCSRWSALLAAYFVTLTCVPYRFDRSAQLGQHLVGVSGPVLRRAFPGTAAARLGAGDRLVRRLDLSLRAVEGRGAGVGTECWLPDSRVESARPRKMELATRCSLVGRVFRAVSVHAFLLWAKAQLASIAGRLVLGPPPLLGHQQVAFWLHRGGGRPHKRPL